MKKTSLNFDWTRTIGSRWSQLPAEKVNLPDDYILTMERRADNPGGGSVGFFPSQDAEYSRELMLDSTFRGTLLLYLDGAYEKAEVFLDENLVQYHPYGYTGVFCDLSRWIKSSNPRLRIRTSCQHPASRWYTGGGLYREVTLYEAGSVYIHPWGTFITSKVSSADAIVTVSTEITNKAACTPAKLTVQICDGNTVAASAEQTVILKQLTNTVLIELKLPQVIKWSVDEPHLYQLKLCVETADDKDEHAVDFGVRQIEIDAQHGFRLNGQPMKLRGGCIHHDLGFLGAAAFPRAEARRVERMKAAGFNAIRTAHNPPSTALLDACDRLGMLVLDESFDCWRVGKAPMDYHREFEAWWDYDTGAMVRRDRNHPCVFAYSIGNEIMEFGGDSDGVLWGRRQAELVRSLDGTRPVTSGINMACGRPADYYSGMDYQQMAYDMAHATGVYDGEDRWGKATEANIANLDIAGYNYMYSRYASDREAYPGRVIMGTETMPYYAYENEQAVRSNPHVIGDFVWVAMDFLGEAGMGSLLWGKEPPKRMPFEGWPWMSSYQGDLDLTGWRQPISYYRNIVWGLDRGIHLFTRHPEHAHDNFYGNGWHWEYVLPNWTYDAAWQGCDTAVVAYADCDEVIFRLNGRVVAHAVPERHSARAVIPYEPGLLEAVAYREEREVATDRLSTAGKPAALRLCADRDRIAADGMDLSFIRAEIVDSKGNVVYDAAQEITISICGAGTLQSIGSGDPKTEESFGTGRRRAFEGSVTAAIRATRTPGSIVATFVTAGLPAAQITVISEPYDAG